MLSTSDTKISAHGEPWMSHTTQPHPFDALVAKFYPELDISSLPLLEFSRYLGNAQLFPEDLIGNTREPRPIPTRPYPETEPGVEEWRRNLLGKFDACVSKYFNHQITRTSQHAINDHTTEFIQEPGRSADEHRALRIPEVLENTLRFLEVEAQATAWHVSSLWRATLKIIVKSKYHKHHPCAPVQYGQSIEPGIVWRRPSAEEIKEMDRKVLENTTFLDGRPRFFEVYYIEARLLQAPGLSRFTVIDIGNMYQRLFGDNLGLPSDDTAMQWLDLSQFDINPYLLSLFPGRTEVKLGRLEIDLMPGCDRNMIHPHFMSDQFLAYVNPMFVTQPPCKLLGVYVPDRWYEDTREMPGLRPLFQIEKEDGIRVDQFLEVIQASIPDVLDDWKRQVELMRQEVFQYKWTEFSWPRRAQDRFWSVSDCPRLVIVLDSPDPEALVLARRGFSCLQGRSHDYKADWNRQGLERYDPGTFFGRSDKLEG